MEPLKHVLIAFLSLVVLIAVGIVGFRYFEGLSVMESLYVTVTTITTVGYGDITPRTPSGRVFATVLMIGGVGVGLYAMSAIVETVFEGRIKEAFGIVRGRVSVSKMKGHKIICGAGRTGNIVIEEFMREGVDFVVIERDPQIAAELRRKGIPVIEGDATNEEVLIEAGVERASGLVSTLPSDCDNLLLCISAKSLNPNIEIATRASSDKAAKRLRNIGADRVVMVEAIGGRRLAKSLLKPAIIDFVDFVTAGVGETSLESFTVKKGMKIAGKKISDLHLKERTGAVIIAIIRGNRIISNIHPDEVIREGDIVVFIGSKKALEKLEKIEYF